MSSTDDATITELYRYPVKGLGPQKLDETKLEKGETIPFDRAWAIENGRVRFNPENPQHLPKVNFLMLMRDERLAALEIEFNENDQTIILLRDGRSVVKGALNTLFLRPTRLFLITKFMSSIMR